MSLLQATLRMEASRTKVNSCNRQTECKSNCKRQWTRLMFPICCDFIRILINVSFDSQQKRRKNLYKIWSHEGCPGIWHSIQWFSWHEIFSELCWMNLMSKHWLSQRLVNQQNLASLHKTYHHVLNVP